MNSYWSKHIKIKQSVNKYDDKAEFLCADTDSLMYEIKRENVYEGFYRERLFDFSIYSKESNYYNQTNNLIIGKLKDEICGVPIKGFCMIKANMYTHKKEDNHKYKKAKGNDKNVADDELKYEDYKNVLFYGTYMRHEMNTIQRKDHNIRTSRINEVSLSCYNDKQYIL